MVSGVLLCDASNVMKNLGVVRELLGGGGF